MSGDMQTSLTENGLLEEVRARFAHVESCPFQGARIFFENAGGALTLNSVVETSARFAAIPDNQGRDNVASRELVRIIDKAKQDVRLFFNAEGGQVFVGESGTELLFRLISSAVLATDAGGAVLGSTLEHPATRSACRRWAEIAGKPHVLATHDNDTGTVTVDHYRPHINGDIRVATIVQTSPVTGMAVDVAAIAAAIRAQSPEAIIIVDGIQHACHGQIDIAAYDIDGYVISPYKVFSRHGYGIAWISDRLAALAHNALDGGPAQNWELGTRDTGSYATFSDVVAYFDWLGGHFTTDDAPRARLEAAGAAIHAHEKHLTDLMLFGGGNLKGLADMERVTVIGGADNPAREGLVSFWVEDMPAADVVSRLNDNGIRTHIRRADHYSGNILEPLGRDACIRVSLCHYNSDAEVTQFLAVMRDIAG